MSDEHSAVGDVVKAVAGAVGGLDDMLGCVNGRGVLSLGTVLVCCCSHIARVLGSTGQLEVVS